jgi:hypothetical protein
LWWYLQVEIFDFDSGMRELLVKGVPVTSPSGNQAITKLRSEIRAELHTARLMRFLMSEKSERN